MGQTPQRKGLSLCNHQAFERSFDVTSSNSGQSTQQVPRLTKRVHTNQNNSLRGDSVRASNPLVSIQARVFRRKGIVWNRHSAWMFLLMILSSFCRLGEAANPGPARAEFVIGTANTTGLVGKTHMLKEIPPGTGFDRDALDTGRPKKVQYGAQSIDARLSLPRWTPCPAPCKFGGIHRG